MGLGKTFVGSEKMMQLGKRLNLIVCQKSKVNDWLEHIATHYTKNCVYDLTTKVGFDFFMSQAKFEVPTLMIGIINYDLIFRRKQLSELKDFTLMLDESSLIQNDTAKRSKFVLKALKPSNVILLSGTPTSGKYECLWSQMRLLGWDISKRMYYSQYVDMEITPEGYPIIRGYKNVERLKRKMREYGCVFLKSEEVLDLPKQNFIDVPVAESKEYKKFRKSGIITLKDGMQLVGDTTLTKLLYSRMLCGQYSDEKLKAFRDLIDSTEDRVIVFYNFTEELWALKELVGDRPTSIICGQMKDLSAYVDCDNSITFVQYQAGAMGLNLQKANKVIYFSPPLSSELFEQSKKRIHRIGQEQPCFYYQLVCGIDQRIYTTLAMRKDYTDKLFEEEEQ